MKALLGMAKERRKQDNKEFKPMAKLNLPKKEEIQPQQYQQEFEQQYEPDDDQILGYAEYLGIKLPQEQHLLYIAREGLMANLPADWDEQQAQDGNILYVNRRTGQVIAEHPCDQYYRQLVLKQRKKSGSGQSKFTGIQPVGNTFNQSIKGGSFPQPPPKKDIDPLVKMQMEKKKKKLQQQKKRQFEDKKKQVKQKFEKKRESLESQYKTKEKKMKEKYDQQLSEDRQKMKKKMSEEQRNQQQKSKKQMQKFQRQARMNLQKKYFEKRMNQKDKIQRNMRSKRQEIRVNLQNQLKLKKKQIEDQYRQKMKILAEKQKQATGQKSDAQLLNQQVTALKEQIIKRRISQFSQKIQQQKYLQQSQFKAKINQIQKAHEQAIRNIETSAPKNQIKFDSVANEVQMIQKQQLQALEYELSKIKQLKKIQKQQALESFRKKFYQQKKDDLQRLQIQNQNLLNKFRRTKQQQFQNKIAQADKKIKQGYLNSLKQIKRKFDQQEEIIQIQGQQTKKNDIVQKQSLQMMSQITQKLQWKEEALRGQINSIRQQISKLSKKSKPIRHKLNDDQLRMYQLVKQKLQQDGLASAC